MKKNYEGQKKIIIKYILNYLKECILAEPIKAVTFSIKGSDMSFPIDVAS